MSDANFSLLDPFGKYNFKINSLIMPEKNKGIKKSKGMVTFE